MPRKPKGQDPQPSEEELSPAKKPRQPRKPAPSVDVKVGQVRIAKTAPKKAPAKGASSTAKSTPKTAAKKAAPVPATTRKKTGTTVIKSSTKLTAKQQKALENGALQDLDARQSKFVDLWLLSCNATQSYIDAGYSVKNDQVAAAAASRLLRKVKDHPYTKARRAALLADTEEMQNRVLGVIFDAAMADPREIVEYRYLCCRFCHGKDFKYQFTPNQLRQRKDEYDALVAEAKATKQPLPGPFNEEGGLGYDKFALPNPECPECNGAGIERLIIKDTANISPAALRLYGGAKQTKDGLEVKVHDQKPYLELLARLYGMEVERKVTAEVTVTESELDTILDRAREKTRRQRESMSERQAELAKVLEGHQPGEET